MVSGSINFGTFRSSWNDLMFEMSFPVTSKFFMLRGDVLLLKDPYAEDDYYNRHGSQYNEISCFEQVVEDDR